MNLRGLLSICHSFYVFLAAICYIARNIRNPFVNRILWINRPVMHPGMHEAETLIGKRPGNKRVYFQGVFHIVHRVIHNFAHEWCRKTFRIWR